MSNTYVNKVNLADGTSIIDISDTTAVAADVASGKYFYAASGEKVAGTASSVGAVVITDETDSHGGIVRTITGISIADGDNLEYGSAIVGSAIVGTATAG